MDQGLSWWNLYQTSKYIQNQSIRRQRRRLPKRIYLGSGAWGIALIFSEIETPTMKLPIIYHTWSLKGETKKHLVLLLFKHMIAEHSHPGCGFKRWCVWNGPASRPSNQMQGCSLQTLPCQERSTARGHPRWAWQLGVVQILVCVGPSRSSQIFPKPSNAQ